MLVKMTDGIYFMFFPVLPLKAEERTWIQYFNAD